MSLKELKGLAPWQWDSQTKKHAIGPKGLQDFTEVCCHHKKDFNSMHCFVTGRPAAT